MRPACRSEFASGVEAAAKRGLARRRGDLYARIMQTTPDKVLIDSCVEMLGLPSDRLVVEFTQHTSDEMYRAGRGLGAEWMPAEATSAA